MTTGISDRNSSLLSQILILSPRKTYPAFTEGLADKDGGREEEQSEEQAVGKSAPVVSLSLGSRRHEPR